MASANRAAAPPRLLGEVQRTRYVEVGQEGGGDPVGVLIGACHGVPRRRRDGRAAPRRASSAPGSYSQASAHGRSSRSSRTAAGSWSSSRWWTRTRLPVDFAIFDPSRRTSPMCMSRRASAAGSTRPRGHGSRGHRLLVDVVRVGEIRATGEDVEGRPENGQRHRGALGVPAGPTPAPAARPSRVGRGGRSPHRHVERVVLHRVVRLVAVLRRSASMASARSTPDASTAERPRKQHMPLALVRCARGKQSLCELLDGDDVMAGSGLDVGPLHAQPRHVAAEQELLAERELVVVLAAPLGRTGQHVVDVGDVAAGDRGDPGRGRRSRRACRPRRTSRRGRGG